MNCNIFHTIVGIVSASALSLTLSAMPSAGLAQSAQKTKRDAMIGAQHDPTTKYVRLSAGKARIIDLPVSVRDVLVGQPGIADVIIRSPRKIYLMGRAVGATNAFFFDIAGKKILQLDIDVTQDDVLVQKTLNQMLPNTNIKASMIDDTVFLRGTVRSPDIAANARAIASKIAGGDDKVINLLKVLEDQQVLLQVKIAEVSRRVLKELGVNLGALIRSGNWAIPLSSGAPSATAFGSAGVRYSDANTSVTAAISALETNGLVHTLAEPNLTAISGQSANFQAGGSFPVPVTQTDGRVAVQQEPFGVSLDFTPVVLNSGRISLKIAAEVSDRDASIGFQFPGGSVVPGRKVRRAETTIELPSGGSMMLAGLIQSDVNTNVNGVPGLKDVPVLGTLFRSNTLDRTERELVIIVTSTLVKPIERRENLLDPTIGLAPPSDYDLYALGRIQRTYGRNGASAAKDIKGPIGYIVK